MARNDVYLNINALSPADAVVTGQQDMTAATVPELVLGDTPTFNFYFTDNTNVWPSWAGNTSYSLTWALSDAVAGDFSPAATTSVSTPITGGWSVVLPLNSYDLVGLLNTKRVGQPYPVTNLWQQLRVTDPSGNEITRAMFWTPVRYRAISDTQNTESATPTGGRIITTLVSNALQSPTAAQFYAANPVPTSALGTAANGELMIGNGSGFTKSTLTAGTGITVTNGSGSITIDASGAQETLTATVKNAESVAITKGQVVYLFGATGGFASVKLAYNTSDATSAKTFGVVSSTSIAANGTGTVTCVGVVDGLNLGAYNDGDTLYLGATPGSVTATKPYAPNHLVYVGIVERANNGNGELYVRVQNGYELDEIHDVQITAPKLAGQTLIYDQTNDLWKNARLTGTANQITVTNADAAVTFSIPTNPTLPGNLTVSGTGTSTIGGNLTVSGTGTSSFAGVLQFAPDVWQRSGSTDRLYFSSSADRITYLKGGPAAGTGTAVIIRNGADATVASFSGNGDTSVTGNLTVSGGSGSVSSVTINSSYAGNYSSINLTNSGSGGTAQAYSINVAGSLTGASSDRRFYIYDNTASAIRLAIAPTTGNLLLKGDGIDSGNGKLQLATHTTAAGGIGFGTDVSLFRSAAGVLRLASTSNYAYEIVNTGGTGAATTSYSNTGGNLLVGIDSSSGGALGGGAYAGVISRDGAYSLILRTNSTTALTLDSSQRTFTASAAKIGSLTGTVDSRLHVYESTAVSNSNGLTLEQASTGDSLISFLLTGVQRWSVGIDNSDSDKFKIGTGDLGAADKFTVDTSGNATVAGSIAIGNTVQTAASVASTHKVTVVIGGVTYYLLATNV